MTRAFLLDWFYYVFVYQRRFFSGFVEHTKGPHCKIISPIFSKFFEKKLKHSKFPENVSAISDNSFLQNFKKQNPCDILWIQHDSVLVVSLKLNWQLKNTYCYTWKNREISWHKEDTQKNELERNSNSREQRLKMGNMFKTKSSTFHTFLLPFWQKTCSIQWKIVLSAKLFMLFMEAGSELSRKRQFEHFKYHFHKTNDFMFIVFLQISSKLKWSLKS